MAGSGRDGINRVMATTERIRRAGGGLSSEATGRGEQPLGSDGNWRNKGISVREDHWVPTQVLGDVLTGLCIKEREELEGKAPVNAVDERTVVKEGEVRGGRSDVTKAVGMVAGMADAENSISELVGLSNDINVVLANDDSGKQMGTENDNSGKGLGHVDRGKMKSNDGLLMKVVVPTRVVEDVMVGLWNDINVVLANDDAGKQMGTANYDSGKGLGQLDQGKMQSNDGLVMKDVVPTRDCIAPAGCEADLPTAGKKRKEKKVVKSPTGTWKRRARSTEHIKREVDMQMI